MTLVNSTRVPVKGYNLLLTLSNLVLGTRVDIIRVIKSFSPPRKCKGTELPEANIGSIFVGTGLRSIHTRSHRLGKTNEDKKFGLEKLSLEEDKYA
ncbi:6001_t:CDS:2 [Scutellospora calospora]|uniref:6001_t:CDS:1 n=1 Tax=Scutellospora calospora TaxID=85575 RepID=A0ACA9KHM4_9GLOM|nr:6001_t:CDS:2 [Scutellospora calospora]